MIVFLMLSGCQIKNESIPLLVYDRKDAYISVFEQKLYEHGTEFVMETYDGMNSQIIQNEHIDTILKKNAPAIMFVNLVDRLSAHALIEKAKEHNTKLVFFNREPLASDMDLYEHTYYVGADAIQSARLQASLVMDLFGNRPDALNHIDRNEDNVIQAVILKGQQGHQDAEQRTKFVVDELNAHGFQVEVLEIFVANFDEAQGYQQTLKAIDLYGDRMEVIISNNDAMALGAVNALIDKEVMVDENKDGMIDQYIEPWLPVVGIDGLDPVIDFIERGFMYGTIENDAEEMARAVILLAEHLNTGSPLDAFQYDLEAQRYIWIDYNKYKK